MDGKGSATLMGGAFGYGNTPFVSTGTVPLTRVPMRSDAGGGGDGPNGPPGGGGTNPAGGGTGPADGSPLSIPPREFIP